MLNIIRRMVGRYGVMLFITIAVLAAFQFIIPAVITTLDLPDVIGGVIARLPPGIGAALSDQVFGGLSTTGLLGFGWNHPITHAAGTAVAVVLGARAVAGEVENGTLELVLAQPISRTKYLAAQVLFAAAALTLLTVAGVLGTLTGARSFELEAISGVDVARVAANFLLLLGALYGATLLASVSSREGGRALGVGFLIAVLSFLLQTVATLWTAAAPLKRYALHTYYTPRDVLMTGTIPPLSTAVLGGWTALCIALAYWRFLRRDVP